MIVIMRMDSTEQDVSGVLNRIAEAGLSGHISKGAERTVIGVVGQTYPELRGMLETLPGVDEVVRISRPFKLSGREFHPKDSVINVGGVRIGGGTFTVIAGPCSVESEEQTLATARAVKAAGAHILRGGAFKPRTSPYAFRGMGLEGLKILAKARQETGLPVATELMSVRDIDAVAEYSDIIQIGARNMQNFILLDEVGKLRKPVMLKRGIAGTIEEWLLAAEYILSKGNTEVILCERGIRTYETYTRNTMDISALPLVKRLSHLPIIGDPSHGTGKWYLVQPMAAATLAAGGDGLMVEVHPNPDHALSDGAQSLTPDNFIKMMAQLSALAAVMGKNIAQQPVTA
ncbi:MAG: 3-deoxy-7-phosphoheptulonate synthase [Chloroflexi bacterium]|nr:3-deoxy-7-phosphoheptulonate synthase [Chloroflexota bacterium]